MFEILEKTYFFSVIEDSAADVIKKDRHNYIKVHNAIEQYCREHPEIIVSDINKLLDKKDKYQDIYEVYCENPYKYAIEITNKINAEIGKWVKMNTIITHQEFKIEYDLRQMITIASLIIGKNNDLNDVINPIKINKINYISPEVEIIDIYKKLYLPNNTDEWEPLLNIEAGLFDLVQTRSEKLGGAKITGYNAIRREHYDLEKLKSIILYQYIAKNPDHIMLLGHWAINIIKAAEYEKSIDLHAEKIQIISNNVTKDIENIKCILKQHTELELTYKEQLLHLPKDFRAKRYTLYLSNSLMRQPKPFMDIFNSTEFELVPYNNVQISILDTVKDSKSPFCIANSYVILRFVMIDIWTLHVINKIGKIDPNTLLNKLRSLFELIIEVKTSKIPIFQKVFGIDYMGTNSDYITAKKLERLKSKHYPYIPTLAQKHGQYRILH